MKRILSVLLGLTLLMSIPTLSAQEDDPKEFQGYFFIAEAPGGWFGENWIVDDDPSGELAVFTPTEVDYGTFNPNEDDLDGLAQVSALVDAIREGGVLGVVVINGDMLAEEGMDASLLIGELTSELGLLDFTQGTVEGRGVTGTFVQGTVPGSGALTGTTFGFYGALMTGQSKSILLAGGAPEAMFEDLLPQFEHFAQTLEMISSDLPTTFEGSTEGFVGVDTPNYTLEIPEAWNNSFVVVEEDGGYGVSILSPIQVTLSSEEIDQLLEDLTADQEFVTALSTDIMIGIVEIPLDEMGDECTTAKICAGLLSVSFAEIAGDALVEKSELQPITVGGASGMEMLGTFSDGEMSFGMRAMLVEYQGSMFLVVAGGPQDKFMEQQDTIQQVIDSLTFK
jgi:hypothetical protein